MSVYVQRLNEWIEDTDKYGELIKLAVNRFKSDREKYIFNEK